MRKQIILAATLLLAACNPIANLNAGDEQVERFHTNYSSGEYDALYAMTAPDFRELTSREDFQDLVDLIALRLGDVQSSTRQSFNTNSTPAGTYTTIVMATTFEQGTGTENFVFVGNGDDMHVAGWHVNSDRLQFTVDDLVDGQAAQTPENNAN